MTLPPRRTFLLLVLLLAAGGLFRAEARAQEWRLLYGASLSGEILPCG